ncbi:sirohydrochlorin cobaltochelatase [Streptococcus cuniculi]|uniref:Sirohydrochlorin cobaltochelatase n=1 Tax=Streptococcus cuniculi TaxID=1432788 RepID=A0A4Y9JFD0_9STRE|nr:sirohydrochlorin cobaltochelatase [Streptococcus cuniculi]MBF0777639.1 sirohydrochlorin cobaltochelatase [Streptococcus cuniculi]TFU98679.1 sirohydrochlorin cobaltochelatase [Streptococcus cuniculi]
MSKAILVVSFGTTYPETRKKTIEACEEAIQTAFPELTVYRAFTSTVVIRRIKQHEGLEIPTVAEALETLYEAGIQEVYIQPLHMILGGEYEKIVHQARVFQDKFHVLKIAKTLLSSEADYEAVRAVLLEKYGYFGPETATVLMGHGSQHYAFTAYAAMDHMLKGTPVRIGCVESYPPVSLIEKELQEEGVKTIHLAPFMLVAGDHATNDMTSDEEDSWNTYFKSRGYQVETHLVGLGEYPEIQALYIAHLKSTIEEE